MEETSQLIFVGTIILIGPISAGFWLNWYISAIQVKSLAIVPQRQWLYWVPLFCLSGAVIFVRPEAWLNPCFLLDLLVTTVFGLQLVTGLANLLNMGAIAEGIERRNPAVIWAVCGAWIGTTICINHISMGTGDTIYTTVMGSLSVVFQICCCRNPRLSPSPLARGTTGGSSWVINMFGTLPISLWLLFSAVTHNSVAVALDRDIPSGLRLAGLLVAWGLVIGNSLPNDWAAKKPAIPYFLEHAWIVLILLGVAIVLERKMQPSKQQPFPPIKQAGWFPAIAYLAIATGWLLFPPLGR